MLKSDTCRSFSSLVFRKCFTFSRFTLLKRRSKLNDIMDKPILEIYDAKG